MINAQTPKDEVQAIEKDVASGHPRNRLLYSASFPSLLLIVTEVIDATGALVTPERLMVNRFRNLLAKTYAQRELTRLVVDEAHCVCEHGLTYVHPLLPTSLSMINAQASVAASDQTTCS